MNRRQISDLPFQPGHTQVLVIQPVATREKTAAAMDKPLDEAEMNFAIGDTKVFRWRHHSWLRIWNYTTPGGAMPDDVAFCGGDLVVTKNFPQENRAQTIEKGGYDHYITCRNPLCRLELGFKMTAETHHILSHLMLKQMLPKSHFCNFVDCHQAENQAHMRFVQGFESKKNDIKSVGLVAIQTGFFGGFKDSNSICHDKFALGFILMPGMDTYDRAGIFEPWLKLLHQERIQTINADFHHWLGKLEEEWGDPPIGASIPDLKTRLNLLEGQLKWLDKRFTTALLGPKPADKSCFFELQ